MSGGSTTTKSVGQSMIDPRMYQAIYGAGAVQPIFNKKGLVKNQSAVDASMGTGGGLLGQAGELAKQPALNPLQSQALQQGANYLASPAAMQGYNALNQAGGNLMGFQNPVNLSGMPQVATGGAAPQMNAAQGQVSQFQPGQGIDWLAIQKAIGDTFKPAGIGGAGVGDLGVNWQDAADRALSGEVNNPYLKEMAQRGADVATENYLRNVAPAQRAGARMSGMYGSSRQGIAEGLAQSDLNNQILRASTDLFGGAYENAQQRAAAMAGQMAGLDTQRDISGAQLGLQGQIANQDAALRAGQLGLSTAQGLAGYDLGRQGLGLDAASLAQQGSLANAGLANQAGQANLGASLDWAGLQQRGDLANADNWLRGQGLNLQGAGMAADAQAQGAGMLQGASQIPFQNLQSLYGVGTQQQQAPWQQLGQYANLLYPQANLGAANTSRQTQETQMGSGQIAMGLAGMAMGGLGGMGGMGGLSGLLGGAAGGMGGGGGFMGGYG